VDAVKEQPDYTVVELAKKRYEQAQEFYSPSRQLSDNDIRFVMGDSDNGYQWPDYVRNSQEFRSGQSCKLTVNLTAQHCNQVTNNIRMNRPQGRVMPVDNNADKQAADILGGLTRSIQSYSNADDAHDNAMEYSVWGGEGYWRITLEYEADNSFREIIKICPVADYRSVFIDTTAKLPDKSDAEWGFIVETISKARFKRDYPDRDIDNWDHDGTWVKDDEVLIAEYFHCDYVGDVLIEYADGSTGFKSENKDVPVRRKRPVMRKKWNWCILGGGEDKPLKEREWPGSYLPIVGTFGKQYTLDGETIYKGIVRDIKDGARMVNYSFSAAVETIALQTKVPFIGSAEVFVGHEQEWAQANNSHKVYLPINEFDLEGNRLTMPQRVQPSVLPSAQIEMLHLATEQMRGASGQSNANFGIKSEASSGIGIQRLKAQGEVATFHYPDNLSRALRYEMQILIDLIPKVMDEAQIITVLGLDGKEEKVALAPDMPGAYREANPGNALGIKHIFNPNVGKYDVAITTGASYQTQRQEMADVMTNLLAKNPPLMQTIGDIYMRSLDFPGSEEIARRIEKTIPPELLDAPEGEPVIQQQMQQMQQQMQQQIEEMDAALQQSGQQIQEMEQELQQKDADIMQAQSKAITSDIQAKEAKSLLNIAKAERSLMMQQAKTVKTVGGELINETGATDDDDDGDCKNPQLDELIWKTEENSEAQLKMMEILATRQAAMVEKLALPSKSVVKIDKSPEGGYVGTKTEER
jgi:hypothetical protein